MEPNRNMNNMKSMGYKKFVVMMVAVFFSDVLHHVFQHE